MPERRKSRFHPLDLIERIGNALPEPAILFLFGTLGILLISALGSRMRWRVDEVRPVALTGGGIALEPTGATIAAVDLLSADGLYWLISTLVSNFINFPPLGIVLVGMLGVGVAERTGLIAASLKGLMLVTPLRLLTPMMVFLGVMSSVGSDAGYIVLPPLAAALFKAAGRSPLAGIAAVFAGVSGGFSANLLVSGGDAVMAGLTTGAARLVDPAHETLVTANWWFMIASTFLLTLLGWGVSSLFVERRLAAKPVDEGGPAAGERDPTLTGALTRDEARGLRAAGVAAAVAGGLYLACILIPGWPLHGAQAPARVGAMAVPRWTASIVPAVMILFVAPGLAFGAMTGVVRRLSHVSALMTDSMRAMAPIIVLAFFASQFIACFNHSNLGRMLAVAGGETLAEAGLPTGMLMLGVVLMTAFFNMFMGSMSAKWAILAPIFVPMLMLLGASPALTQQAYRIGDSVTNIISPMNSYLIVILAAMQRFAPRAGIGTLIATMLPYSIVFLLGWSALLMVWVEAGWSLGPGGALGFRPTAR